MRSFGDGNERELYRLQSDFFPPRVNLGREAAHVGPPY